MYVVTWAISVALGFFYLGYNYRWFNALTYSLHMQYMSEEKMAIEDRDLFNSVVSGAIPIGAIFGSIIGGILVGYGRRKAVIIIWIMQIIGSLFCLVFNFAWLILGRLTQGVVIGCFTVVSPLFIREISPKSISGSLGMSSQGMVVFGGILAKSSAFLVPLKEDEDLLTSENWKIIFGFPGVVAFFQLLLMIFIFKFESPIFYLNQGDNKQYCLVNSKIYIKNQNDLILIDQQTTKYNNETWNKMTWAKQFSSFHLKALVIGWTLSLLQQGTGINCVSFYSNEMFMYGLSGDEAEITARIGTLLVNIVSIFGVFTASYMLKMYGRKSLMKFGTIVIWIIYLGLYLFSTFEITIMIKVLIFLFMFTFNISIGGILWVYISETLNPKGIILAAQINWIGAFFFGSTTNIFFELVGPPTVYFSYAVIQMLSFLFISIFVKETKDLSKNELEQLYRNKYKKIEQEIELIS